MAKTGKFNWNAIPLILTPEKNIQTLFKNTFLKGLNKCGRCECDGHHKAFWKPAKEPFLSCPVFDEALAWKSSRGARKVLNPRSQKHHSIAQESETATPKESMTRDVQVNISKAVKFTIACRPPARPPLSPSSLKPRIAFLGCGRSQRWAFLWGGLFCLCVKTLRARVKADDRLGMSGNYRGCMPAVRHAGNTQKKSKCAVSGMHEALRRESPLARGQRASRGRPRALPSQTDSCVFHRNCSRGPLCPWKHLHKLVNLEGRSPFPPTVLSSHSDTLMMKRAEGKHDAHRHLFIRADAHLQRRRTVHQGRKVKESGSFPQRTCISLTAGHRGGYCMYRSWCCSAMDNTQSVYLPFLTASRINLFFWRHPHLFKMLLAWYKSRAPVSPPLPPSHPLLQHLVATELNNVERSSCLWRLHKSRRTFFYAVLALGL